jgi:hypothetical protein
MGDINDEIKAFQTMQAELESSHMGEWALVYDGRLVGTFDTFEAAADSAVQKFGRGPFLIRQVGAPPTPLPISALFAWPNAER